MAEIMIFDVSGHPGGSIELPGFGAIEYVTSDNNQRAEPFAPIAGLVQHWTAGGHLTVYAAYHWGIADNGTVAAIIRTLKPTEKGAHLWGRNSGNAGAAYAATADSNLPGYGPDAPTRGPGRQREAMAVVVGEFCAWHHLDPRGHRSAEKKQRLGKGTPDDRLVTVTGSITVPVIASHQTFAAFDQYADERWDTGNLLPTDQLAAAAIYDALKAGTRHFTLSHLL